MKTLISAALILFSSASFASNIPTADRLALCDLHYSKIAYGKEVSSVLVHAGFQTCPGSGGYAWTDVKDLNLEKGDAFTGKLRLDTSVSAYDRCKPTPAIQFWVNFADGSSKIENAVLVLSSPAQTFENLGALGYSNVDAAKAAVNAWAEQESSAINSVSCLTLEGPMQSVSPLVDAWLN